MKYLLSALLFSAPALAYCGDSKSTSPAAPAALVDDGNKLLTKGQFSAALAVWQKVLEQEPDNANANFKMGMCYFNSVDE